MCENDFVSIVELENYFNNKNLIYQIPENVKNICINKKIFKEKIKQVNNLVSLELLLFFSITNLDQTMPQSFLDFFNIYKTSLTELSSMSNEELIKLRLNNYQINQLKNALEF